MRLHDIQDGSGLITRLPGRGIMHAWGAGAPSGTTGYAPGCIFTRVDGSAGTAMYINEGTSSAAVWVAIGSAASATIGTLVNTAINASAAAATLTLKANTALAWSVTDGTTSVLKIDTRNTIADVSNFVFTAAAPTIATAAAAHLNPTVQIEAKTVTYTGTNTVTSSLGAGLHIGIPTFTDASAGTLSLASNLHVAAVAAAGGSLTLSAARMISTGVADCYLTNAGVWTDTACWAYGKEGLDRSGKAAKAIDGVLAKIQPATWKYRGKFETVGADGALTVQALDDRNRDRVGIVYDDLPDELRAPGEEKAVSTGILASFALAAVKRLSDQNDELRQRIAKLEKRAA